jgi:hypothetical protein
MRLHKRLLKSMLGKAAVAAMALGGCLSIAGASSAQAAEVVVYHHPVVRNVVRFERPVYYGPAFRYERREVFVHGWRDRFGCWHRY